MGNMGESTCVRKIPTDCGIAAVCLERERGTKAPKQVFKVFYCCCCLF